MGFCLRPAREASQGASHFSCVLTSPAAIVFYVLKEPIFHGFQSAHVIGSKGAGGAEIFYCRLITALRQGQHRVIAVNPEGSAVSRRLGHGIPQRHIAMRNVWDWVSRFQIRRFAKRSRTAIVQTYMGRATRLTHLKKDRFPIHVARLGGYYNLKGYRHAHAWVGNTRGIRDYLVQSGLPPDQVFYIPNFVSAESAIDPDRIRDLKQSLAVPETTPCVVAIGRFHPNKGFSDLIQACAILSQPPTPTAYHLVIAGDGPLREALRRQAGELGIEERTHWLGWQEDLSPYYQLADVFVCPSVWEPLGNVILEAWANRAAVLSTETAGAREIITPGETGVMVPVKDPRALAESLKSMLDSGPAALKRLGAQGHRELKKTYSEQGVVRRYSELYSHLASLVSRA